MKTRGAVQRTLCSLLAAALILTAPGLPLYRALAQTNPVRGQGGTPAPGGFAIGAQPGGGDAVSQPGAPSLELAPSGSLTDGLGGLPASNDPAFRLPEQAAPDDALRAVAVPDAQGAVPTQRTAPELPAAAQAAAEADAAPAAEQRAEPRALPAAAERVDQHGERLRAAFRTGAEALAVPAEGLEGDRLAARRLFPEARGPVPPHLRPDSTDVPPPDDGAKPGRAVAWAARAFLLGQVIAAVGVEAWGTYFPKWAQVNFTENGYDLVAAVGMASTLLSGYVGGWAVEKIGLKKTYLVALGLGAASIATALVSFHAGSLGLTGLVMAVTAYQFLTGVARVAEQTIPVAIHRDDPKKLESLNAKAELALNAVGVVVPSYIGLLLTGVGHLQTLGILPLSIGLAILVYGFLMPVGAAPKAADTPEHVPDPKLLRVAKLAYPTFVMMFFLFFQRFANMYGNVLHPGTDKAAEEAAAAVAGQLMGGWAFGAMIAALALSGYVQQFLGWVRERTGLGVRRTERDLIPKDDDASARRTAVWMRLGALGLLGFLPMLGSDVDLARVGMFFFGLTNIMGILKILSMLQANSPRGKEAKTVGMARTWAVFGGMIGLIAFGQLAGAYPGFFPLQVLTYGLLPLLAAWYLWTASLVSKRVKEKAADRTAA